MQVLNERGEPGDERAMCVGEAVGEWEKFEGVLGVQFVYFAF